MPDPAPHNPEPSRRVEVTIAWLTLWKIAAFLLLAFLLVELRSLAAMLFAAILLATTLTPVLEWALRHRWPRWAGVLLCAVVIFSIVGGFVGVLVPTVSSQGGELIKRVPTMRADFIKNLPETGDIRYTADQLLGASFLSDPGPLLKNFVTWGAVAVEGLVGFIVTIVIAIYLVADGDQVYRWLIAFIPKRHRARMATTATEVAAVVRRWITGQALASMLAAIYAFAALSLLHVPNASLLAVFAGVFDIIPVIGFFCATVPAMASALTVSPGVAVLVGALYLVYHLLETYFLLPKIFGDRLKLSMLAVLISCVVAGYAAGPLAIVFVLPIVASYPVIERIWLQPYLESDTVREHDAISEDG